jgi:hypothetical protein
MCFLSFARSYVPNGGVGNRNDAGEWKTRYVRKRSAFTPAPLSSADSIRFVFAITYTFHFGLEAMRKAHFLKGCKNTYTRH